MKNTISRLLAMLVLLAPVFHSLGAVSFSITPALVSNTYNGTVTLQITGLTNGEAVVVQKFLDANTNDAIDAGDLLWQQFSLTDGVSLVIGGVTNINVPGDTDDTANGQITVKLYQQPDFSQTIAGDYLVRLSSPSGNFPAITHPFTVTSFPYAQRFTGTVVSNGVAVPNAVIVLFQGAGNNLANGNLNTVGGTVANNAGVYSLSAPAGTYLLTAFKSNYVADASLAGNLILNSGANLTTNLSLKAATCNISGKIVDAGNPSLGLPGLLLPVLTMNNLLAVGFSDPNGNFTLPVTADHWQIQGNSGAFALHGYLELQDGPVEDTTTGSVAGVTIALPKATALFYGTVKDNLGNPLPGTVAVGASDNNGTYIADGFTDTNGYYVTAALGGLGGGDPWQVQVDNSSSFQNYIFSQQPFDQNGGTNLTVGAVVPANFTAILATNHIHGNVQANGTNIVNVGVYAYATIGGVDYSTYADTDNNGNYSFNVANGSWTVGVNQYGGNDSLENILGSGNYQPPGDQIININNNNWTANFSIQTCDGVQFITASPLPSGMVNSYYSLQFQGSSCYGGLTWSVNDPQDLPAGMNLYSGGAFNGTSQNSGTFNFSVHVDDGNGHTADSNYSLTISAASSPLVITNNSLPNGNVGAAYGTQLGATGGQSPYTWALALGSANPPPGLTLNSSGLLAGVPTTNGLFNFIVQAKDNQPTVTNKVFGIIINPKPVLSMAGWSTNQFSMRLAGGSNQNYTVQVSTNLNPGNWTTLLVTNNPATNSYFFIDPSATNKQRFYRVLIGP